MFWNLLCYLWIQHETKRRYTTLMRERKKEEEKNNNNNIHIGCWQSPEQLHPVKTSMCAPSLPRQQGSGWGSSRHITCFVCILSVCHQNAKLESLSQISPGILPGGLGSRDKMRRRAIRCKLGVGCGWWWSGLAERGMFQVTDTPGLCDTHRDEGDVFREVWKSVAVASPGPHVILMVLRCDKRFTEVLSLSHLFRLYFSFIQCWFLCLSLSLSCSSLITSIFLLFCLF